MKIRATTNQLGLAPMRIPKTRASWIDPVPIRTHGGRRAQGRRAERRLTGLCVFPSPAACPASGTCACPSSSASASARSSRSPPRSSPWTCATSQGLEERPQARDARRGAAHHRRAAGRGGLRRPPLRPDGDGPQPRRTARGRDGRPRPSRRRPSPPCATATATRARPLAWPPSRPRSRRGRSSTTSSTRPSSAATRATPSRPSPATPTRRPTPSSRPSSATSPQANTRPRGRPTSASPRSRPRPRARRIILGALALLAALILAARASRATSAAACAPSRRAAEALAEGDVDHELSVKGRDEVGRTAGALATMVEHLRSLAGAADRVAAGDLTVDARSRAPSATASAPPSPASWPSCAPP